MKNKLDAIFEMDYLRLSRLLIRKFNLNTAVMLSEIYSEYKYWEERNELQKGGWFYSTIENMAHNTSLSKHQQLVVCKELVEYGVIKIKYHGMPKKRYFKLNMSAMDKLYRDCLSAETSVGDDENKFKGYSF